jgi:hypothetical protein
MLGTKNITAAATIAAEYFMAALRFLDVCCMGTFP